MGYRFLRLSCLLGVAGVALLPACGPRARPPGGPAAQVELPPPAAASAPLRRLTQEQYRNTRPRPAGGQGPGHRSDHRRGRWPASSATPSLPVSELHLEKYGRAAELVARQAVARLPAAAPLRSGQAGREPACARQFIDGFGRRAFRRPLTAEEMASLRRRCSRPAGADGDLASGVRLVLQAMLQSPHFLYLVEPGARPRGRRGSGRCAGPALRAGRPAVLLPVEQHPGRDAAGGGRGEPAADPRADRRPGRAHDGRPPLPRHRGQLSPAVAGSDRARRRWRSGTGSTRCSRTSCAPPCGRRPIRFVDHVVREGDGRLDTLLGGALIRCRSGWRPAATS